MRSDESGLKVLYKTLAKDSAVYFMATVGAKIASMAIIPFAAYLLGASKFATYDEFLLINTLLTLILLMGIDSAAAIKISLTKDEQSHGQVLAFMLCVTSVVFIILLVATASLTATNTWTRLPLWHSLLCSYGAALQLIVFTYFRYKGHALSSALVMLASAILSTILGLLFIFLDTNRTVQSLLSGVVLGQIVGGLLSLYLIRGKVVFDQDCWKKDQIIAFLRLGLPFVPASLSMWARKSIDRYLIALYFGDASVQGAYALMARLAELAQVALGTVGSACTPLVLRHYAKAHGQKFAREILYFAVATVCLGAFAACLFSTEIVLLLDRQNQAAAFSGYHSLLLPLTTAGLISGLMYFSGFGFQISQRTGLYAMLLIAGCLVQATVAVCALHWGLGLQGLAFSAVAGVTAFTILYIQISERLFSFNYKKLYWLLPIIGISLFSSMVQIENCKDPVQARHLCANSP